MVLADGSHAALIEQPETINFRLDRFIRDHNYCKTRNKYNTLDLCKNLMYFTYEDEISIHMLHLI